MKLFAWFLVMGLAIISHNGYAQSLGKIVDEREETTFPQNALGGDIMFSEGGFGAGMFYQRQLNPNFTFFGDFSFSEAKDDNEVEYFDWFGNSIVPGKVNRIFSIPFNFGLQYRLFRETITDNLRPYINAGVGPHLVMTTPFSDGFFSAFGSATTYIAAGGYVGLGAKIGSSPTSLVGINIRYYYTHLFNDGVEGLRGNSRKGIDGFYITVNIGSMY